jgi:hypothetical protein
VAIAEQFAMRKPRWCDLMTRCVNRRLKSYWAFAAQLQLYTSVVVPFLLSVTVGVGFSGHFSPSFGQPPPQYTSARINVRTPSVIL